MPTYHFTCERSRLPEDQVPGLVCGLATSGGKVAASSAGEAKEIATSICCIPGLWTITIWRGRRMLKPFTLRVEPGK